MKPNRPFRQVDVFTAAHYRGNPLAVVLDSEGIGDEEMQRFARWTNLSETTFLLPPRSTQADYRVRIFTPGGELPFAGHPTLGSAHCWLEAGGAPKSRDLVVQECGVGLVRLRREGNRLAFAAPALRRSDPSAAVVAELVVALGIQTGQVLGAQSLDNGPVWLTLLLDTPATVLGLKPDHGELKRLGHKVGVSALYPAGSGGPQLEVRAFAAAIGITEDPVTGSLNASLAQWLIEAGRLPPRYLAAQGTCLDRAGRIHIERDEQGQVWVGGESVTCVSGTVVL